MRAVTKWRIAQAEHLHGSGAARPFAPAGAATVRAGRRPSGVLRSLTPKRAVYEMQCGVGVSIGDASLPHRGAPARCSPVVLTAGANGATLAVLRAEDFHRILADGADGQLMRKVCAVVGLLRELEEAGNEEDASKRVLDVATPRVSGEEVGPLLLAEARTLAFAGTLCDAPAGASVVTQGDVANELHIVVSGALCCAHDAPRADGPDAATGGRTRRKPAGAGQFPLAILEAGDVVGAEALHTALARALGLGPDGAARYGISAFAHAEPTTTVLSIPADAICRTLPVNRLRAFARALHAHARGLRRSVGRRSSTAATGAC